jgi:Sulfotransferase domain
LSGAKPVVRIAMWSGPRNISTAMMRAFGARADCAVSDEPFYAAYLAATGLIHPMRDEVIASQPTDWREVASALTGPSPEGKPVWYQKHMTHHMLPEFGREWCDKVVNAFLIRAPEAVLASYSKKRADFGLEEIGLPAQVELFDRAADRLGAAPPVIESQDLLADPRGVMTALCEACGIPFDPAMLSWESGRRATDGVWAPAWYEAVERSTGFAEPSPEVSLAELPDALKAVALAARPYYDRLARHRLEAATAARAPHT